MKIQDDKIKGSVLGFAYADAYGAPYEFMRHNKIVTLPEQTPDILKITDDTQMSLYVLKAYESMKSSVGDDNLANIDKDPVLRELFTKEVASEFIEFYNDPDNNRAPGKTCMRAISKYINSPQETGLEGQVRESKGNSANIRAAWIGLLPYGEDDLIAMSLLQARVTHGHNDGLLAAVLTTLMVNHLALDKVALSEDGSLIRHAIRLLDTHTFTSEGKTLDKSNLRSMLAEALIVFPEFLYSSPEEDICSFFGEGWTADEALVLALAATNAYVLTDDPIAGVIRLSRSEGDSDSIAALGGAFLGASGGYDFLSEEEGSLVFEDRYEKELEWAINLIQKSNHEAPITTGELRVVAMS